MPTLARPETGLITTDVIDSPACAMPQYATYRRHYWLVTGSHLLTSAETHDEIVEKAKIWADRSSRIVRTPAIGYYDAMRHEPNSPGIRPVGTAPWAGGTWSGRCGSTIWFHDPDRTWQKAMRFLRALNENEGRYLQEGASGYNVSTLQAWWINGIADREPMLDGFPIECQQKSRHTGLCSALDQTWDWRDYAPWTDQGHDTQLDLF